MTIPRAVFVTAHPDASKQDDRSSRHLWRFSPNLAVPKTMFIILRIVVLLKGARTAAG